VLNKNRTWLLAHSDESISETQYVEVLKLLERRKKCEPIAYIVGKKDFYGREFLVTPDVLIPRSSTEVLINAVGDFLLHKEVNKVDADTKIHVLSRRFSTKEPVLIADIGTGSGCIAITLALAFPHLRFIATDVSNSALSVAKKNIEKFGIQKRIELLEGDLLHPLNNRNELFLVVSNPPYVPESEKLMLDIQKYEPNSALWGGESGHEIVERLLSQAEADPYCVGICVERRVDMLQ
jgi:release factor glutamine methyltransferase